MALSDRQIRNAEPKEKRYSLTDGGRSLSRNLAKRRQMVAFLLFHQWQKYVLSLGYIRRRHSKKAR